MKIPFFESFAGALAGFYALIPSYGIAIILLTILVRLILLPLSIKQTKSMREMQRIQPEVKKLQQKHKGDRQKLNEEMMALYKEHGVNPFGGCAPLLLQFPVIIALYQVISKGNEYMDSSWALAKDLGSKALDVYQFVGIRLDCSLANAWGGTESGIGPEVTCADSRLGAFPYVVMIALLGFTTYYQSRQMAARRKAEGAQQTPQAQQMQAMTRIMPIFLMVISYGFPTAVTLYWLTTNVWTIGQQRVILARVPETPPAKGKKGKPDGPKDSKESKKASGNGAKFGPAASKTAKASSGTAKQGSGDGAKTPSRSSSAKKKRKK